MTAADGEEGLRLAQEHLPDLVITDYQMPVLSGLELSSKLRADPRTAKIPIIMLTARGFSLNEEDLRDTSIRKVLSKPFSPREVLGSAKEIVEGVERKTSPRQAGSPVPAPALAFPE